jgi:ribosomal protein L40E
MSTEGTQPVHPEPQQFPETEALLEEPNVTSTASQPVAAAFVPDPHADVTGEFVCLRCGSRDMAVGYIVDYGDKFEQIHFAPIRITLKWLNSIRALHPWRSLAKINAEACRNCGTVMLVIDPEDLRRAEHRRE